MSADLIPPDRLPPQSREAEKGVIGSVLRDNAALSDVLQIIRPDNFYFDAHQKIFQAVIDQYNDGKPVDLLILHETLKQRKQLEDVGGAAYLAELWDAAPTAANAEYYARIVRDKAIVRNLIHTSTELLRDAYDGVTSADELLGQAERSILEIAEKGTTGETHTLDKTLKDAFDRIDQRAANNLAVSGVPSGFVDLDNLTAGFQNNELIILAARPSVGKCLTGDSEILLADGRLATIGELVRRRSARLLTLGSDWRLRLAEPSAYVDDGVKPVYRVRTRLGRVVEATASHPFRTLGGWRPLAELRPGDRVAVPRALPVFGSEPMRDCEVKLLAYLIGDGGLTDRTPEFTNSNPRLRDEFAEAVRQFGGVKARLDDVRGTRTPTLHVAGDPAVIARGRADFAGRLKARLGERGGARRLALTAGVAPASVTYWIQGKCVPDEATFGRVCRALRVEPDDLAPCGLPAISRSSKNPLTVWLDRLGLWGKPSRDKFVPAPVFALPRPQLALFLNRLFATDGWATVLAEGQTQIGYATVSERLARQVQHLLLRFGVIAGLRERRVKYRDTRRPAWQLDITEPESVRTFAREVGIFGKEPAVTRVLERLARKRPKACRDTVPPEVWGLLDRLRGGDPWARVAERAGLPDRTNLHVGKRGLSRGRLRRLASAVGSEALRQLADGDVYWDRIVSIEPAGMRRVYDLTVPGTHNFVANDVCVHNTALSLNIVRHVIVEERLPVFFVSLEQSRVELAERLLCSQARVDSHRLRKGHLNADDLQKLIAAGDQLKGNARDGFVKLFIDDTPAQTMLRIAANARRLKLRHQIRLVVIDYLQLIEPENRRDPRQEQVAQISRRLKFLARELQIPVISLAQVNRASEDRQDHKPRLSDLRESGCLTGDTLIPLADSGARVPIRDLVGRSGLRVWALDETTLTLKPAEVARAFPTGRKPVFRLETRLGRVIRATANHPFRGFDGWRRLDELRPCDRVALPRTVPGPADGSMTEAGAALLGHLIGDGCTLPRHAIQYTTADRDLAETVRDLAGEVFPGRVEPRIAAERDWFQVYLPAADRLTHGRRNPVAEWLDRLGVFGLRSHEKRVPGELFAQPDAVVARFLRHLWATDGCVRAPTGTTRHPAVYYASSSERLARDVQELLLRFGVNAVLRRRGQGGKGRDQWHLMVMGHDDLLTFADRVGAVGVRKLAALRDCRAWLEGRAANPNRDTVPQAVWDRYAKPAMRRNRVSMRAMQAALGMSFAGATLYKSNVSRSRLARVADAVGGDDALRALAASDVYWDEVASVTPDGEEEVFDLTVPGPHNFVANGFVVHNSIEQDADTVLILHRPGKFDGGQEDNILEVIVAKQRNGPTGEVTLSYLKQFMRYENYAADAGFGPGI